MTSLRWSLVLKKSVAHVVLGVMTAVHVLALIVQHLVVRVVRLA
jgi:hypothetical protein